MGVGAEDRVDELGPEARAHRERGNQREDRERDADEADPGHHADTALGAPGTLNERLSADPGVLEYLTMAYLTLDLGTGRVTLVQAGHPPPLVIRADGAMHFIGDGGLPIGLINGVSYVPIEITLHEGDRLLLYSDGITETEVPGGGMLDQQGLAELAAECLDARGTEFLDDLYWRLSQRTRLGSVLSDDVSAALVEFGPRA